MYDCKMKVVSIDCRVIFSCRYSVDATLDVPLSKQLAAGRLFVGQKLRVMGWPVFIIHLTSKNLAYNI